MPVLIDWVGTTEDDFSSMEAAQEPTFAQAPFDNPAGDATLQTVDGVHFLVRTQILLEASSGVFADMLREAKTENAENDTPIITISEESDVLDPLLRLAYPIRDPVLDDLTDAPDATTGGLAQLQDAFPGAELLEER